MRIATFLRLAVLVQVFCALPAFGVTNSPIDLTVPASLEPQTDQEVFDESVIFSPNFGINQNDPALSDLFGTGGSSNLCFPTALAENLVYLLGYHQPKFASLQLAGLSANQNSLDSNALVRDLAAQCKTNPENGTKSGDALNCALSVLSKSGYQPGDTRLISPFNAEVAGLPISNRDVTIKDIRDALKAGNPVILEAAWFSFDPATKAWVRDSGHYVGIYGYDYNESWGENQIQLRVINPETNYGSSRQFALWDSVMIERVSPHPGISYPQHRPFILSGSGFGGLTKRGFLGMILVVAPGSRN